MSSSKNRQSQQSSVWGPQTPFLQGLYQQGQQLLPGQMEQAQQLQGPAMQAWQGMINPQNNPYLGQMAQSGLDRINQNFQQDILPSINTGAMQAGQVGSSRQGIAQGLAAQSAQQAGSDFMTNLYGGQYQGDMNRAMGALGMTPTVQGISWNPLQQYAGLLGRPTVLSSGYGRGKSLGIS